MLVNSRITLRQALLQQSQPRLRLAHTGTMIDFTLSPTQQALRKNAANFAQAYLKDAPATYNQLPTQRARFESTAGIYRAAVQAGLIKGQIPTALGGGAEGLVDAAILVEEFFAVEPSAALTILGTGLGLTPLLVAGNEELWVVAAVLECERG